MKRGYTVQWLIVHLEYKRRVFAPCKLVNIHISIPGWRNVASTRGALSNFERCAFGYMPPRPLVLPFLCLVPRLFPTRLFFFLLFIYLFFLFGETWRTGGYPHHNTISPPSRPIRFPTTFSLCLDAFLLGISRTCGRGLFAIY